MRAVSDDIGKTNLCQFATFSTQSPYDKTEQYLLQAQGLNLALWTSSDVHEQIKPVCSIMSDLLHNIAAEVRNMQDE